ncbi:hypothetical protein ONE63_005126 [Megalurothrips usitatus]|uniref:Cytochrome P450 6a14 n=1 Tax=Megalurothrips usitatus TaxID=439358 RepID=A0AAV7XUD4_9NEOP|nr:hypothetical protein ONE63_005126 [Megalurothrips usitatus]
MLAALKSLLPAVGALQLLLAVTALMLVRYYFKSGFWHQLGVLEVKSWRILFFYTQSEYPGYATQEIYTMCREKGQPCAGFYLCTFPTLVAVDLELIRAIVAKDFSHFMGRGVSFDRENEPMSANLINLEGNEWRSVRHKLTPTFSSGRMRAMFPLVSACAEEMVAVLRTQAAPGETVSMLDMSARYSIDVIGSCAFGIQANALTEPETEFRVMGERAMRFSAIRLLSFFLPPRVSALMRKYLNVTMFDKDVTRFFNSVFEENFQFRQQSDVKRHDFVDLLLEIKNNAKLEEGADGKDSTGLAGNIDDIIQAQALVFFLAGFETISGTLANTMTELAHNPDVQDKARAEVQRVLAKHGGQITYEALHDLTYLEQVIEETMRLYPTTSNLPRIATEDYTLPIPAKNGKPSVIQKGTRVVIPIYAIHRDPEFYTDPDKFNPDNFTAEAKKARPKYAFLPFGAGPRICIAIRFAMMQLKAALAAVLRDFHLEPMKGSKDYPPRFRPGTLTTKTYGGNKVLLRPLTDKSA